MRDPNRLLSASALALSLALPLRTCGSPGAFQARVVDGAGPVDATYVSPTVRVAGWPAIRRMLAELDTVTAGPLLAFLVDEDGKRYVPIALIGDDGVVSAELPVRLFPYLRSVVPRSLRLEVAPAPRAGADRGLWEAPPAGGVVVASLRPGLERLRDARLATIPPLDLRQAVSSGAGCAVLEAAGAEAVPCNAVAAGIVVELAYPERYELAAPPRPPVLRPCPDPVACLGPDAVDTAELDRWSAFWHAVDLAGPDRRAEADLDTVARLSARIAAVTDDWSGTSQRATMALWEAVAEAGTPPADAAADPRYMRAEQLRAEAVRAYVRSRQDGARILGLFERVRRARALTDAPDTARALLKELAWLRKSIRTNAVQIHDPLEDAVRKEVSGRLLGLLLPAAGAVPEERLGDIAATWRELEGNTYAQGADGIKRWLISYCRRRAAGIRFSIGGEGVPGDSLPVGAQGQMSLYDAGGRSLVCDREVVTWSVRPAVKPVEAGRGTFSTVAAGRATVTAAVGDTTIAAEVLVVPLVDRLAITTTPDSLLSSFVIPVHSPRLQVRAYRGEQPVLKLIRDDVVPPDSVLWSLQPDVDHRSQRDGGIEITGGDATVTATARLAGTRFTVPQRQVRVNTATGIEIRRLPERVVVGDSLELRVQVRGANNVPLPFPGDAAALWEPADGRSVSVRPASDSTATLRARAPGQDSVVAYLGFQLRAARSITVVPRVARVELSATPAALVAGDTAIITARPLDADGNDVDDAGVLWTPPAGATLTATEGAATAALLRTARAGVTLVRARVPQGAGSYTEATLSLDVEPVLDAMTASSPDDVASLAPGDTFDLRLDMPGPVPGNRSLVRLLRCSSDPGILEPLGDGFRAVTDGIALVRVRAQLQPVSTEWITVRVGPPPADTAAAPAAPSPPAPGAETCRRSSTGG